MIIACVIKESITYSKPTEINPALVKVVDYGLDNAFFYKAKYVYVGPDDADLSEIEGTCVRDLEEALTELGFLKIANINSQEYLDNSIRFWRKKKSENDKIAQYYIDAFQSMRISIFGEKLSEEFVNDCKRSVCSKE